ncbi:MAG: choice-of-anchor L domain-containing protein [Chitinophagales bacterium]|nr:choice-of-anchor L domain-containing protein [Chitinophagales bacterium]
MIKIYSYRIFFYILSFIILSSQSIKAQLIVTSPVTAEEIVTSLLGCGSSASNITFSSCGNSAGFFTALNTNLGIDSGVLISSGNVNFAVGPNLIGSQTTDNGCGAYPPLTTLSGQTTLDAAVLDFDVMLNTDTLKFNYVFGSEEYMEYVGSFYNDVFGLWISGPGITGLVNLATLPGGLPVTQANVNCTSGNGAYYVCNDPLNYLCNATYNCPTNSNSTTIEFDGFTTVLEAKIGVIPGQTYHLTFAIADAVDAAWDSGVFIEAGFLEQYAVSISSDSLVNFVNPFDSALSIVEGCQPGVINIFLENFTTDTVQLPLLIGGTATSGVDYTALADTLSFVPGDSSQSIFIGAFADGLTEGNETVIIYTLDPCTGLIADSFEMNIVDDFPFEVSADTTICEQDSLMLNVTYSPFYQYNWQPSAYLICDTCSNTVGFPPFSTAYVVGVTLGNCTNYDTVSVSITAVDPFAGDDQNLCNGDTLSLLAVGGTSYTWTPSGGLSDPTIANPLAFPTVTTNYIVTAIGTNPLCQDNDTILVNVVPNLVGTAGSDTAVCPGKPVQLWAAGGDFYKWEPATYLNFDETASPLVTPEATTTYTVTVSNIYNCSDVVEVTVEVFSDPVITINQPYEIYIGESAQLFAHAGVGSSYSWQPDYNLSDPNIYNPIALPDTSTTYYVVITTSEGCLFTESTKVDVLFETLVAMPNAFTPNGDGLNEELTIIVRGPIELNSFKVFDRWGNPVFLTTNINDGWNGKIQGKNAEIGTYVYSIDGKDGNGQPFSKHGNFLLLR